MSQIDLIKSPIIQSPYVYLQAAGSDGTDRTIKGNHLRWDFLKILGEKHLAKGEYTGTAPYVSNTGFNRPNDFIKIYRAEFKGRYASKVDFGENGNEITEIISGTTRAWKYSVPVHGSIGAGLTGFLPGITTAITVRLIDHAQYDAIRATQKILDQKDILEAYTGIVEIETDNKLSFCASFALSSKNPLPADNTRSIAGSVNQIRIEAVSIPDTSDLFTKQVSCRKKFTARDRAAVICCENIQYYRFDYINLNQFEIEIFCYEDQVKCINEELNTTGTKGAWDLINSFYLTTSDAKAIDRFLPTHVDRHWPKFNDDSSLTGEFTVRAQNYLSRWRRPGFTFNPFNSQGNDFNSLQYFVHKYMELSKTDERALASIPSDTPGDPSTQDISYVDMIRLMSLDFHVARILGLGHVDQFPCETEIYHIYCLEYKTFVKLETPYNTDVERTHIFMTIPVSGRDHRLPPTPNLTPLTYGISVDNGTATPTLLTDAQGYAPFGNIRFINVNRGPFNFERSFGPFYYDPTEFCLCGETQPVAYGLEYKEIHEADYRKPEISHDPEYIDASGLPETVPILEGGTAKIFTHQELEEGTHEYRAYAINWFSRISPLSNPVETLTAFPKQSHLLPPFNFAVQLIQDEDPAEPILSEKTLILTTPPEQNRLAAIPAANDKTLVRTTFDWNYVHHHAHQYADYAEIFFRRPEPLIVKGKVAAVNLLSGHRAQVSTTSYPITSTPASSLIVPAISASDSIKFAGSFFSSGGDNYVIESVIASGTNPSFIIKQLKQINAIADTVNPGQFISNETFKSPVPDAFFFITENMGDLSNWDLRHSKRIYLEKFYTNAKINLKFSPTRSVAFDIKAVSVLSGNTKIMVEKPIHTGLVAGLSLAYSVKHRITAIAANSFTIPGDATADLTAGKQFRVFGNKKNDGLYTVSSSIEFSGNTIITIIETIADITNSNGLIEIVVSRNISAIDMAGNSFEIMGDKEAEINAAYCEYKVEEDNTVTRFVVGGINDQISYHPIFEKPPVPQTSPPYIPKATGFIQLNFLNYDMVPHIDADVKWDKGIVRLKDVSGSTRPYPVVYIGNMLSTAPPHLCIVIQDPGFIPGAGSTDTYTIDFNLPQANYHPSYKLYLDVDNGFDPTTGTPIPASGIHFDSTEILPLFSDPMEGNRQTYMSIRSYDSKNDLGSFLSNPVVLLAQKISIPEKPGTPKGPLYATRPDFYGKSTYTFDTEILNTATGRVPYSVVFYRSSEDLILDVLYRKSTQAAIWEQLNALPGEKTKYDPNLWKILFEGDNSANDPLVDTTLIPDPARHPLPPVGFRTYIVSIDEQNVQFTWPLPDKDGGTGIGDSTDSPEETLEFNRGAYVFPFEAIKSPAAVYKPFKCDSAGIPLFDLNTGYTIYGKMVGTKAILNKAIMSAFLPLTEQPPMYNYIKEGKQTSGEKARSRDASGNIIKPIVDGVLVNDIFPMIRRFTDLNLQNEEATYIRFTDYNLDGASRSIYFYRALEMDDKFKFSEASLPVGPVMMVNAFPPDKPQIRKLITILQNASTNTPSSVQFEINEYSANEKITKVEIYRATNETDALSIRTMKKAKSILWGMPLIDDFSDIAFPPYGETIYYRIIAIREIEDVEDVLYAQADPVLTVIIDLPSLPSEVYRSGIVDVVNPPPPKLYSENGITTPAELQRVLLKWEPTCYNGTYRLQKLNASGNWVQIYTEKVTGAPMQYPPLLNGSADFGNYHETEVLPRLDADGNAIYHRFRVRVENSSGLFNLTEYEITLAKGCSDLQEIESVLDFSDANSHSLPILRNFNIVTGASQPGHLKFEHQIGLLPAGHNSFMKIDITVKDDANNTATLSITVAGANVVFNGTTAPTLDLINPNRIYTITTRLFTDNCTNGVKQKFIVNYLAGPCYDLKQIATLIKLTDSNHDFTPLPYSNINNGIAFPTFIRVTDVADLTAPGQTFEHMEISISDDLGHTDVKIINTAGDNVIFDESNGLVFTNPNRIYNIKARLFTDQCIAGHEMEYTISYTYTPCDDLSVVINVARYTDNNGSIIDPIKNQVISAVSHPGGSITIQEIASETLPPGHAFDHLDVILEDDSGGAFTKTINVSLDTVTFNSGEGNLALDSLTPHRTYFVTLRLFTTLCPNGKSTSFTIKYN